MNFLTKKILILTLLVLVFVVKLIGDIILFSLSDELLKISGSLWNYITSVLILSLALIYFYIESKNEFNIKYDELNSFFNVNLYQTTFLIFISFIIISFYNNINIYEYIKDSYFGLIIKSFKFLYLIISSIIVINFCLKTIWSRRKKNTREIIVVLTISAFIVLIFSSIEYFLNIEYNLLFNISSFIVFSFYVILLLYLPFKKNWISFLSKKNKTILLLLSLINFIFSLSIFIDSIRVESLFFKEFNNLYSITSTFISLTFAFSAILNARLFLNSMITYPSSKIFERKNQELNNLTNLNKFISDSINKEPDFILKTIFNLALETLEANGGWIINEKKEINTIYGIKNDLAKNQIINFSLIFENMPNEIQIIESISHNDTFSTILKDNNIKSIIILPITVFEKRKGIMFLFKNEDYGIDFEVIKIMSAFKENIKIALENAHLFRESIEKERIKRELLLAQEMQKKLLPQSLPKIINYNLSVKTLPANEVGGDYYDIVKLKNGKYCIIVGDVSGKGISAAFYMAQLKGVVLAKSLEVNTGKELLIEINKTLYGKIDNKIFITLSTILIDDDNGNIRLCRAGHLPAIHKNNTKIEILKPNGIGISLANNSIFEKNLEEINIKLLENSAVILFTDGITEINSYNNEELGLEPIVEICKQSNNSAEFVDKLFNKLYKYIKINLNHDDMTVFALYYKTSIN
jgi:serine phosphatase RsbU (regulator of sigma subunit)